MRLMDKNIDTVRKHFSEEIYVKEMYERNILGLKDWEKVVANRYFNNKGKKILNIGCGPGREAMALSKLGFKITGIDISEIEINIAKEEAIKQNLEIEFLVCDGINLEFDNDYFDYSIIWAQTLGNIYTKENRIKLINENKRVLKNNGILCFSTHDFDFVKTNFRKYTKGNKFYPYLESDCYWKLFTIKQIKVLIEKTGLKIIFCGKSKEIVETDKTDVLVCICKK